MPHTVILDREKTLGSTLRAISWIVFLFIAVGLVVFAGLELRGSISGTPTWLSSTPAATVLLLGAIILVIEFSIGLYFSLKES